MYVQKKRKKFAFWTVTQSLVEKKKTGRSSTDETKRTTSYCLLLLERMDIYSKVCSCLDFFSCCCCFFFFLLFFYFLVCAVSMDSSKVGKCRIACRSCLSRGEKPKQNTHTQTLQFPLFENALSTHIRQECCFFSPFFWLFFSVLGWKQSLQTYFVLL